MTCVTCVCVQRRALTAAQVKENDRKLVEAARDRPWTQIGASDQLQKAARWVWLGVSQT